MKYLRVPRGTHVATLHPPTGGEDGCDVLGKVLKAVPGKAAKVEVHDSLSVDAEGRLVAQIDGVLVFKRGEIAVSRMLEVSGTVDFNTGHIDFDGTVVIKEGIQDRFKVKATEDITVDGLIQAAEIDCGGDFHCRTGMAARERGTFRVGGDAYFNYVDGAEGRVEGNMFVVREIRRSKLVVNGDLTSARGAIIGGEITVTGSICIATLGSRAGTPTTLILGEVPSFDANLKNIRGEIADMELARKTSKNLNIEVTMLIHPQVTLKVGDDTFRFHRPLKGPVTIGWSATRELQYRQGSGGAVHLLTEVAKLLPREAA